MDVELQATCSALGFLEGNEYIKEPDCLETVKDLIRFLRHDSDVCDIRRQLGHAQILQNDLIPLIKFYHKDKTLFDTVIKLMVNLTQPVITCFNNEIPDEKTLRNNCLEVEGYLQDYKEAFISEGLFGVLAEKIQEILKLGWDERREEDKLQLERLFVVIRNILMVPSNPDREQRTEDDASIHDQILWAMHTTGVEDLILYVASSDRERTMLCMHIVEIIFLMLKEQEVQTIVSAGVQRSITEKEKDQIELEQAREKERAQRKASILKFSARHSRFGGTFTIKNMKSISQNDVIYHKPLCEMEKFSLDSGKVQKKISRNRAPIKTEALKRRSTLSMRLSLKEFCVQFLVNAYNPLMRAVKDALTRKTAQDNDETYYLWTMRFFMEFCRLHFERVDLISETMSLPTFHYIYTQLCTYYENIRLEKGEVCKIWGRRAHLALKAYNELLSTLDFMCRSEDSKIRESAQVIQSNVFYIVEYRDIFVTLIKNFKESKSSRAYLRDLVESTHVFLKMLERFVKSSRHLVVQKKKKQKRKPKKGNIVGVTAPTEEELEADWNEHISGQLVTVLQSEPEAVNTVSPFDAASDMDIEEQRIEAMLKIQVFLREKNLADAVSLFHAAREVWPERDEFGSENMSAEEESSALQEIFMASLQRPQASSQDNIEEEQNNEIEEEEREEARACETEFDFKAFINDFAHPDLIKNYAILLAEFANNSDTINHCIVKMMHRISHDLGYIGMLFQASVFRAFNFLLQGHYAHQQRFQELSKFACYVVRQFTSIAQANKRVFIDLLFWKSRNEALAITNDYDFNQNSKAKILWTEHQEQELQSLYEKYRDTTHPELDVVDQIQGELTSSHTRLQILKELKKQGLITSAKDIKKKSRRGRKWTEEELQNVKDAFQMHCDSDYPIFDIMKTLNTDKSKNVVIVKIIDLGLVQDKQQLLKKRRAKSGGRKQRADDDDGDDEGDMLFADTRGKTSRKKRKSSSANDTSDEEDNETDNGFDDEEDESEEEQDRDTHILVGESPSTIGGSVRSLVEKGYNSQLAWIIRGLRNTAEDRQDGVCVPTPLVPLTEENEIAMDDEVFLAFLRSIGISSPLSEQEMFWRIPAEYSAPDLTEIAACLELLVSGEATDGDDIQTIVSKVFPKLSTKSKDRKKNTRQKVRTGNAVKTKQKPKKKIIVSSRPKDGDTSDSGLDPEIEAAEQERIREWKQEKIKIKSKLKTEARKQAELQMTKTEARKQALLQMMEKKKSKRVASEAKKKSSSPISLEGKTHDTPAKREKAGKRLSSGVKKRMLESDSESNDSRSSLKQTQGEEADGIKNNKRLRLLSSEDEDDHIMDSGNVLQQDSLNLNFSDSEDEPATGADSPGETKGKDATDQEGTPEKQTAADSFPATFFTQDLESDDDDDHIPLRAAVRKVKAVIDDDDDD